jgi:2,3-dihydroxybiphenyl 1,2-dioxygenase
MRVRTLAYVGIETRDLDGWADFSTSVLGLPAQRVDGGERLLLRMDERVYRFDVRDGDEERLAWIGWELANAAELDQAEAELEAAGVGVRHGTPEECLDRRVAGLIVFDDPAGNRNELFYGQQADFRPLVLTRPLSGYLTADLGMGHVVMGVKHYAETLRFYVETMGFRVSDTFDGSMAFLHCNRRHHSIALVSSDEPGLRHIMLEVDSIDDVGATIDVCLRRGIATRTLGRHTNDRAVSFYLSTPSGWEIEYGWSGQAVDDDVWTTRQLVGPTSLWGHQHLDSREILTD